jgi:hypothetical protein
MAHLRPALPSLPTGKTTGERVYSREECSLPLPPHSQDGSVDRSSPALRLLLSETTANVRRHGCVDIGLQRLGEVASGVRSPARHRASGTGGPGSLRGGTLYFM